jgi:soluble lytic murein transglycosylase-like protein
LEETIRKQPIAHLLFWAAGTLAAVGFTVSYVRPAAEPRPPVIVDLVNRGSANGEVLGHAETVARAQVDSTVFHAPWLHMKTELALRTPQFLADRERFARDLLETGKVEEPRAWQLADVAVRESYRRRLPPALVLGVLLTENEDLDSDARSSMGAVGLMQVHVRHWVGSLGRKFGTDVENDTTNLRYGIFILGYVAKRAARGAKSEDSLATEQSWRGALLRYNGCVRGTNTPNCASYPVAVRRKVMDHAKTTCNGRDFDECVARPLWLANKSD